MTIATAILVSGSMLTASGHEGGVDPRVDEARPCAEPATAGAQRWRGATSTDHSDSAGGASKIWPPDAPGPDLDQDGISDAYESAIAARFRPIFVTDAPGVMSPGSVEYLLTHADAIDQSGRVRARLRSLDDAVGLLGLDTAGLRLRATFDLEHGDRAVAEDRTWGGDKRPTVFARVVRVAGGGRGTGTAAPALPQLLPDVAASKSWGGPIERIAVQYFFYCYYSDADFPFDMGDHDGDWGCIDLTLIVGAPAGSPAAAATPASPLIESAVFHNHGRQLWTSQLVHRKLTLRGDRILVYLEGNSNEPWPNASAKCGFDGWPSSPGFLVNRRFEKCQGIPSPRQECKIVRSHRGKGDAIDEYRLIQLGERGHPADSTLAKFVMSFTGRYGVRAVDLRELDLFQTDPPQGPPSQPAMWERRCHYGDFSDAWEQSRAGTDFVRKAPIPPIH